MHYRGGIAIATSGCGIQWKQSTAIVEMQPGNVHSAIDVHCIETRPHSH